jgi:hypothetical protein
MAVSMLGNGQMGRSTDMVKEHIAVDQANGKKHGHG